MEGDTWKKIGKIFASICLSVIIAFFWISQFEKSKISEPNKTAKLKQGMVLEDHLDKPYNLISFWASWCVNCEESLKNFNSLASRYPEKFSDFNFATINVDEKRSETQIRTYWDSLDLNNLDLSFDKNKSLTKALDVNILPTYFLVSKNGELLLRFEGQIRWQDEKVLKLLWSY